MSDQIIKVNNLTKHYGDFVAVDGINFSVNRGETFGILGPNGAGKTTTLEMIEGLKGITSGRVQIDKFQVAKDPRKVKSVIGVQLQSSSFFDELNLKELLELFASFYDRKVDAAKLLADVQLTEKANSVVKELSGGQKQRFSIATALVNDPLVIFLDEPTTGLDPQARRNLWELVENIKKQGKTVVLTTHYMEEAEVLCDRIAIMDHAKIITLDTTENLLTQNGTEQSISFNTNTKVALEDFKNLPGVKEAHEEGGNYRLISENAETTLPALIKFEHTKNFSIKQLQLQQTTLEDVFLKLTGKSLRD